MNIKPLMAAVDPTESAIERQEQEPVQKKTIEDQASHKSSNFESAASAYRNNDFARAFTQFSQLAQANDPRAQSVLAIMYKFGESVAVDFNAAYLWYLKAAEQGYPPAQFNVGRMLAEGIGVDADQTLATYWLTKASNAGYERANNKLAELNDSGEVISESAKPVVWSHNWNLRLPNAIRDETETGVPLLQSTLAPEFRVQLGAMRSTAGAKLLWQQIKLENENFFAQYQPIFLEGESNGQPVVRLQLGTFEQIGKAEQFCQEFDRTLPNSGGCLVLRVH